MSKARDLSNFISVATVDATEMGANSVTTTALADLNVTHAKLHTDMNLSSKTLTLGNNQISGNAIDGGVISNFASTGIDDNSSATAVTILSDGKVGIGTAAPNANLHAAGSSTNIVSAQVQNTEGTGSRLDMYAFGSSPAIQSAHRAAVYQWTGAGIDLWSRTGDLHFGTSNVERMRIDSSGNVNIVTSLDINGNPAATQKKVLAHALVFGG
tara:strand:+ start:441 stop:1076 length:636 start_codon:yes stop_codon:yes gene_type:complete